MEMTVEETVSVFKDKLSWANQNRYPYVSQREAEAYRMGIKALEQEACEDTISRQWLMECVNEGWIKFDTEDENRFIHLVRDIAPSVTPQKTGHWIYKIYGGFHEQGDWYCSHCDYQFNYGEGHAKYCPGCGYKMSEAPTEEVIGDRDYDWVIKR